MQLRQIHKVTDPVLPAVIELYQIAFPVREQMFASFFWTLFDTDSVRHLVVVENEGEFVGFVVWEQDDTQQPGYAWYIAVKNDMRGKGIGEKLYRHALEEIRKYGCPAMMYEVELPAEVREHSGEVDERIALKRIDWYRKLGAQSLDGVHYDCGTDWQKAIPMLPMIHPLTEGITAQQAYDWGIEVLAESNKQNFRISGELHLT